MPVLSISRNGEMPLQEKPSSSICFWTERRLLRMRRGLKAVCRFLETVRKDNPKAAIVWAYGMLGQSLADLLKRAVDAYKEGAGIRGLSSCFLKIRHRKIGARSHPGVRSHAINARILADFLKRNALNGPYLKNEINSTGGPMGHIKN